MTEKQLTERLSEYLKLQYKSVVFRFDLAADTRLTIGQAKRQKKIQGARGYPDLFIASPRGRYHGLYLELKIETPFKKDGTLKKNQHLEEQAEMHIKLSKEGYKCTFGVGFDECKEIIDNYLKRGI